MITDNSWKKNLYALFISQFFYRAGTRSIIPFLPLFVNELGSANVKTTSLWTGWIFAAPFIVSFLTTPIWGSIGDKYGRKLTTLLALAGFVAAQFSMSLASSLTTLLIAASLQELFGGAYPAAVSLAAANSPKERTADALSYLQLANALGNIAGPVMGGILADIFGFRSVFAIVAVLVSITSIPIIFFVKEETIVKTAKLYSIWDNLKYFTAKKRLVGCGMLLLAYTLSVTMMRPNFTLYIHNIFSGISKPSTAAGILLGLFGAAGAVSVALLPLIGRAISSKIKLLGALTISALMFLSLTWFKDIYSFALVLVILGFALGVVLPLIYSLMSDETEQSRKAGILGIGSSFQMAGNLVGPLAAGYIATLFGLHFSFIASGIILAFVILFYFFFGSSMIKQLVKKIIKNESTQDSLRLIYNSTKTLSGDLLHDETKFRSKGLPDGFPYPPSKLIFTIIAIPWVSEFYKSGKIIFDDMSAMLSKHKVTLTDGANILDFGCGCGRIIRHFASQKKYHLFGSDLNPDLISWCDKNLAFGKFSANNLVPPLNYEDDFFDLIYARSVFTHLGKELQLEWINELKRILKPGGLLYFTTHGNTTITPLSKAEQEKYSNDEIVLHNSFGEGDNKYSSYQSFKWTTQNLLDGFELAGYQEGSSNPHLRQDVYLFKKQ